MAYFLTGALCLLVLIDFLFEVHFTLFAVIFAFMLYLNFRFFRRQWLSGLLARSWAESELNRPPRIRRTVRFSPPKPGEFIQKVAHVEYIDLP